ncbi:MAG: hypothetical protein WKF84_27505 [Pyrinomonadaceae bacterium]
MNAQISLPGLGTAIGFSGERKHQETFYLYSSFTQPAAVYRYDLRTNQSASYREPKISFNPRDYETKQVFFESKDKTRVPMFITHKKGLSWTAVIQRTFTATADSIFP